MFSMPIRLRMKTYQAHLPDKIHSQLKAMRKRPGGSVTIAELMELSALLLLAESGAVQSVEDAKSWGAQPRPLWMFERIIQGEAW